ATRARGCVWTVVGGHRVCQRAVGTPRTGAPDTGPGGKGFSATSCVPSLGTGTALSPASTGGPPKMSNFSFAAPLALAAALFTFNAQAQSTCESSADCPMGYE